MDVPTTWQAWLYAIPSTIAAPICLLLVLLLARRPSRLLLYFCCFYLISVANLAAPVVGRAIAGGEAPYGLREFWAISMIAARLRYVFLVLFAHSVFRFRAAPILASAMAGVVVIGAVAPLLVYSTIPSLSEIAAQLFVFAYWLTAYLSRARLAVPARRLALLRSVLACSGVFLIGLLLDALEDIPESSVYFSIILLDFQPAYLACIGAAMAAWSLREQRRDRGPARGAAGEGPDLEDPRVSVREREIIRHILGGETNADIAEALFISESTVKKHVNNIFRKLGISSRWELLKLPGTRLPPK